MLDFSRMMGYQNNAYIFEADVFNSPSNVFLTDNPPFSVEEDFLKAFPQFTTINGCILNMFYTIADAALKEKRFKKSWRYMMCLYMAHLSTLYLMSSGDVDESKQEIINSAFPRGIASSKSVDGLSISYDFAGVTDDMAGFGTFKYTIYGQQLITFCRIYKGIGMWVNG